MGRQRGVAFGDLLLIDLIEFIPNLRNKQWLESGCPGPISAMDSHTLKCKTAHCMNFIDGVRQHFWVDTPGAR